jgi:hypothetical protein
MKNLPEMFLFLFLFLFLSFNMGQLVGGRGQYKVVGRFTYSYIKISPWIFSEMFAASWGFLTLSPKARSMPKCRVEFGLEVQRG